jgi:pimeloyl-ACP methyl ester carboxylesterase
VVLRILFAIFGGFILIASSKLISWTPPIFQGGSVASLETMQIGGVRQNLLIRGDSMTNPVLLFLHGGPGMPAMYLAHSFQASLEKDFVVVQWDQRGAGKSYDPSHTPVASMNVVQFLSDAHELTVYLERRFHQPKIFLVGHSWGSYLGMLAVARHPELYRAYVGVGQIADSSAAPAIQDHFIVESLMARGDSGAARAFERNPLKMRENYLFQLHGELYRASDFTPLLYTGLTAPEYTIFDALNVAKGPQYSSEHMAYNAISGSLADAVPSVQVPIHFFVGRHDYTTPTSLTVAYFDTLKAPTKSLVWFEESAHFPFFEEPAKFAAQMRLVRNASAPV